MKRPSFRLFIGGIVLTQILMAVSIDSTARAATADHLIISEVVTKSRQIGETRLGSEFIEIVNPTNSDIDLSNVYLSDAVYAPGGVFYWNIANGVPSAATTGGGTINDFHVRFPAACVLSAGDTLAVAVSGSSEYFAAYGRLPDFELYEDNFLPDIVPEMEAVFPGSVQAGDPLAEQNSALLPNLSDTSESLILYQWDGNSELVDDLDFMYWGTFSEGLFDKSGVTVGASTYLDDTPPASQETVSSLALNFGQAYARLSADEGTESPAGGNGSTGHDETSENLSTTWWIATQQEPPSAPPELFASAPIFVRAQYAPLTPLAGQDVALEVEVYSYSGLIGVDFIYTVDGGAAMTLPGADQGGGTWSATLPGQAEGAVVAWYAAATNADSRTATWPTRAPVFTSAWTVDPEPDPALFPAKLLITEVSTIGIDQEYVEITNPGLTEVDLAHYYLTDAIYSPANQVYWRIAEGNPSAMTIGGGAFADFHARFPDGSVLAAGDTIVVSVAPSDFFAGTFGFLPDFELWEATGSTNSVTDMAWIFGDETNNSIINRTGPSPSTPSLTNSGEVIVLYHWDGVSDHVTDIDVFHWKDPVSTSTSYFFDKTGVTVGTHSYLPDTPIGSQMPFPQQADFGRSYHRTDATEGAQIPTGSNGVLGRDETSEDLPNTFVLAEYDPSRAGPVLPPEGDWQVAGLGPAVMYGSVGHAWGQFDQAGADDLFLVRPAPGTTNLLLHNVGLDSAADVESFGTADSEGGTDCFPGDFNQDGDLDLYLAKDGATDWLYTNLGLEWNWGLWAWPMAETGVIATTDAVVVDTDLDGWLEVLVLNGTGVNQLLTGRYGMVDMLPYSLRRDLNTYGGSGLDLDGDRDPDFITLEGPPDITFDIQGQPLHYDPATLPAAAEGRDCAWADLDNDGDFDFVLVCDGRDNVLYKNQGDGTFTTSDLVRADGDSTAGCSWGDFDNDGRLDLYELSRDGLNILWRNESGGIFAPVMDATLDGQAGDRAATWVDIDRDGDLDLYFSNSAASNRFVRCNLPVTNNWLQLAVTGQHWGNQSNLAALGALVAVEAGGIVQWRTVGVGDAGPGHAPLLLHFGLGTAAVVDRITVRWPIRLPNGSFHSTVLENVAVNQRLSLEETVYGVSGVENTPRLANALLGARPNPFNPATEITYTLAREAMVDLKVFDVAGRLVRLLVTGETKPAGRHRADWQGKTQAGTDAPSGVYLCRLRAGDFTATQRVVLIR